MRTQATERDQRSTAAGLGFVLFARLAWKTFFPPAHSGARRSFRRMATMTAFLPLFLLVQGLNRAGLALDHLLFPAFRDTVVRNPVFIVGIPRSGTTLLHRLLAGDEARFTAMSLWELLFAPSISQRYGIRALAAIDRTVGAPILRVRDILQRRMLGCIDDIHATTLDHPEEDYLALIPLGACYLLTLPFPFAETRRLALFDSEMDRSEQEKVMAFYRGIIQRHLYIHGTDRTYLSKNPSFSPMLQSLRRTFPDARFVGCFRAPEKAVPSLVNSMARGAALFDNDLLDGSYRDELVSMLDYYYRYVLEILPTLPEDHYALVTLEGVGRDLPDAVAQLYGRFGWGLNESYAQWLVAQQTQARRYRSTHSYCLEDLGLEKAAIQARFSGSMARLQQLDHV